LARLGLRTVADVLAYGRERLVARLGDREGGWLYDRARGIDPAPVESRAVPQSLSRDETFPRDLSDDEALATELLRLADRASADLRDTGLVARTVTVKLRDADFTTRQASRTLPLPVQSDRVVYAVARELLGRLRADRRVPARLLGVSLSQLVPMDAKTQLSLFERAEDVGPETERDRALARAMDELRERFGPDALQRGRSLRGTQ